jgi:protein-S-isoprenylcysteine O-methyltransferase Ste14
MTIWFWINMAVTITVVLGVSTGMYLEKINHKRWYALLELSGVLLAFIGAAVSTSWLVYGVAILSGE